MNKITELNNRKNEPRKGHLISGLAVVVARESVCVCREHGRQGCMAMGAVYFCVPPEEPSQLAYLNPDSAKCPCITQGLLGMFICATDRIRLCEKGRENGNVQEEMVEARWGTEVTNDYQDRVKHLVCIPWDSSSSLQCEELGRKMAYP